MSDHLKNAAEAVRLLTDEKLDEYYARSMRLMVDGEYRRKAKAHLRSNRGGVVNDDRIDRANEAAQDLIVAEFTRRGRPLPTTKAAEAMFKEIVQ